MNGVSLSFPPPLVSCKMPLDPGPSDSRLPSQWEWGFDSATGKCVKFIYRGWTQGGNANRFSFENVCEAVCGGFTDGKSKNTHTHIHTVFHA